LQLRCKACHWRKAQQNLGPIDSNDVTKIALWEEIKERVRSPRPMNVCDRADWC
jgi:hypothetical protein